MFSNKIFFYTLVIVFFTIGCKKNNEVIALDKTKYPAPHIDYALHPSTTEYPKLTPSYIQNKKNEIEHFFSDNLNNEFDNISFLVAQNGQIIDEKYEGYIDKSANKKITAETPIHLASVSKVLTATAILKLIDAKKINLDQKVNTILTGFPYPDVTIRTLLNHRSGIKKYNYFCDNNAVWDKHKTLTNKDILDVIITKKIPLETPTDSHFSYCNTNYALLALVIEKITGMKYTKAMKEMIFYPLGMKNTFVFDENSPETMRTFSYKSNYSKIPFDFLDAVYGDKNIYSTPRDLLKLDLARKDKSFLNKELLEEVYKGYSYESKGIKNYGLGIRLREWPTGQVLYYHNGWWHGNTTSYTTLRKENTLIIALTNKFTHKTYQLKRLSVLFGDYPFQLNDSIAKDE